MFHALMPPSANMALTSWKGSIVRKQDITVAKNYLSEDEIDTLNRLVVIFLETAELRAKNRQDIRMNFWRENVDKILELNDQAVLRHKGKISNQDMERLVQQVYAEFNSRRKHLEAQQADAADLQTIEALEEQIKKRSEP